MCNLGMPFRSQVSILLTRLVGCNLGDIIAKGMVETLEPVGALRMMKQTDYEIYCNTG